MKKIYLWMMAVSLVALGLSSCSDENDPVTPTNEKVSVTFRAKEAVEGTLTAEMMKGLKVLFTEVRSKNTTDCVLDEKGMGTVNLDKGTYDVSIEERVKNPQGTDSLVISVRMENVSINTAGQAVEGRVNVSPAGSMGAGFIFSEIFFNGETNSGRMMHPDQYFVLFNPTSEVLYADGVSMAVTQHLSFAKKALWYDTYYPDRVPIGGFVTVPGNGREHPVQPGGRLVIAFTAVDHSKVEGYDHAVDLTGADFEIYEGPDTKDVDNPDVPNMIVTNHKEKNGSYGFFFHPRGYVSPLLFKLENGEKATVEKFIRENTTKSKTAVPKTKDTPADTIEINIISIKTDLILDGVQTSDVPQDIKTRVIPEKVDRGKFIVNGCHRQELAIRREIRVGSKIYYKDTNNSTVDFIMKKGQNSYPKGWRDKK